jgi:hypothetical protein
MRARFAAGRKSAMHGAMIDILEAAIEKVRTLPPERQAYAAEVLELIAAAGTGPHHVSVDHRAAVLEGVEKAKRREFATDEEMAALWKKCGL